jgi:predicted cytidylate kinase
MEIKKTKITIGGLSGTGKGTVAKMLAEKLGYEYMSVGNFVRETLKEKGIDILEYNTQKNKDPEAEEKRLDLRTEKFGSENDNFVFEGHISAFFIPDAFKILLKCDEKSRLERIANRQNISFEESKHETLGREEMHAENYKKVYQIEDHVDPSHYDFVIDTTNILPEQIVESIINKLK